MPASPDSVLTQLERLGHAQSTEIHRRHGAVIAIGVFRPELSAAAVERTLARKKT